MTDVEHVLNKILSVEHYELSVEILNDRNVSYQNPKISIAMHTQKIQSEVDGPNMWHFLSVFAELVFSRGEKS